MIRFDYKKVYETAREFAERYSEDVVVQEDAQETVLLNGEEYPCVPLKFIAKGNTELYKKLLDSGCCTKMDGSVENGKRIRRVLLWIEQDCERVHNL